MLQEMGVPGLATLDVDELNLRALWIREKYRRRAEEISRRKQPIDVLRHWFAGDDA